MVCPCSHQNIIIQKNKTKQNVSFLVLFIRWHISCPGQMRHLIFVKQSYIHYLSHNYADMFSIPFRKKKTLEAQNLARHIYAC